ncbi:F510_1955 family glycosylhydrolase, partial [Streptomyces sp. NPDC056503]|uniref:F510_1955 family glycosylhydrolase n=1 Tax=Streptomyces sp. NPDC056503 TaxID=3345842 RepID=UPI0036C6247E
MQNFKSLVYLISVGLALLPSKAFAHGGVEEPQSGLPKSTYGLLAMGLLFILFVAFYMVMKKKVQGLKSVKKKEDRIKRQRLEKNLQVLKWGWILSLVGVVITGSLSVMGDKLTVGKGTYLEHIHGLGYSTDGKQMIIPAHDGLKTYSEGHWGSAEGEKHDYMGFSAVDDGFYSSGHPAPGSDKKNPFGIVKSTDEGKTFETLDLYGEIDFHLMSVGYQTHAIYVINPQPNSRMDSTGLYYSIDEAKTWTKSAMKGISEEPTAIAVHPSNEAMLAIGTQSGVFLSKDNGQTFEKVVSKGQATSLFFNT